MTRREKKVMRLQKWCTIFEEEISTKRKQFEVKQAMCLVEEEEEERHHDEDDEYPCQMHRRRKLLEEKSNHKTRRKKRIDSETTTTQLPKLSIGSSLLLALLLVVNLQLLNIKCDTIFNHQQLVRGMLLQRHQAAATSRLLTKRSPTTVAGSQSAASAANNNNRFGSHTNSTAQDSALTSQQQHTSQSISTVAGGGVSGIKNVTAQNGQSVLLHCLVEPSVGGFLNQDLSVSWFRGTGELQLLTYESNTIIQDERFVVRHGLVKDDNDWALQIKNLDKNTDSGIYQCQTNSDPPHSQYYQLNVVEPQVHILGEPDLAVRLGSPINLTCVISQTSDQPQFIFWYRDNKMINYDLDEQRGKILLSKWPQKEDTITSSLQIFQSKQSDSGNYTCMPSGAKPISIQVYVLEASDRRVSMYQREAAYDPTAVSSQLTNSAISVHVVRLSRGRAYAFFVAFIVFASWLQLVAQVQTGIIMLLLAIIGFLLGKATDKNKNNMHNNNRDLSHYFQQQQQHQLGGGTTTLERQQKTIAGKEKENEANKDKTNVYHDDDDDDVNDENDIDKKGSAKAKRRHSHRGGSMRKKELLLESSVSPTSSSSSSTSTSHCKAENGAGNNTTTTTTNVSHLSETSTVPMTHQQQSVASSNATDSTMTDQLSELSCIHQHHHQCESQGGLHQMDHLIERANSALELLKALSSASSSSSNEADDDDEDDDDVHYNKRKFSNCNEKQQQPKHQQQQLVSKQCAELDLPLVSPSAHSSSSSASTGYNSADYATTSTTTTGHSLIEIQKRRLAALACEATTPDNLNSKSFQRHQRMQETTTTNTNTTRSSIVAKISCSGSSSNNNNNTSRKNNNYGTEFDANQHPHKHHHHHLHHRDGCELEVEAEEQKQERCLHSHEQDEEQEAEMIELVRQPTALKLIMDEFMSQSSCASSRVNSPVKVLATAAASPAQPTGCSLHSPAASPSLITRTSSTSASTPLTTTIASASSAMSTSSRRQKQDSEQVGVTVQAACAPLKPPRMADDHYGSLKLMEQHQQQYKQKQREKNCNCSGSRSGSRPNSAVVVAATSLLVNEGGRNSGELEEPHYSSPTFNGWKRQERYGSETPLTYNADDGVDGGGCRFSSTSTSSMPTSSGNNNNYTTMMANNTMTRTNGPPKIRIREPLNCRRTDV